MTLGLGFPGGWWTPLVDAAMRDGTQGRRSPVEVWSQDSIEMRWAGCGP